MSRRLIRYELARMILHYRGRVLFREYDVGTGLHTVILRLGKREYLYLGVRPLLAVA